MFRSIKKHPQSAIFTSVDQLSPKLLKRLKDSWAEAFSRLDEEPFAVLNSDIPPRPNIPVNVLVGFEVLKAGFGNVTLLAILSSCGVY